MRKKDHSRLRISLALTFIVICLILLAAGLSRKPQLTGQALAAADASQAPTEGQEQAVDTAKDLPPVPQTNTKPQMVNGVEIRFEEAWQEGEAIAVNVCFDLPDDSDWGIWNATLEVDGVVHPWWTMTSSELRKPPVDDKQEIWEFKEEGGVEVYTIPADPNSKGYRCDTVFFQNINNPSPSTPYTFSIEALEAAPREGEYCTDAYLEKVQAALDDRQTGITVKCIEDEYMDGLEVVIKPETMSLESAQAYLTSTDFYLDLHGIRGPWVFTFTID
jgi:hypothetical protein